MIGPDAGEVMATVQMAMYAGFPFTTLRDAVIAHPTMAEGLNVLFSSVKLPAPSIQVAQSRDETTHVVTAKLG